jgi:hypothetical protein
MEGMMKMNDDMTVKELIEILLKKKDCYDGFECPFGMFGQNKKGHWGCFAKYPNGNLDGKEENQGCIAYKAGVLLKTLMEEKEKNNGN